MSRMKDYLIELANDLMTLTMETLSPWDYEKETLFYDCQDFLMSATTKEVESQVFELCENDDRKENIALAKSIVKRVKKIRSQN